MTAQTIQLSVPSHPRFLQVVRGIMGRVAEMVDFPASRRDNIILAVDEACSNIIKYAYFNDPCGVLEFSIRFKETQLEVVITDYGKACDISRMKPRDLNEIRPGGLGTYIISQVMDEVEYQCGQNGKNRIRMVARQVPDASG